MSGNLPMNPWAFVVLLITLTTIGAVGIGGNMWLTAGADTLGLALQMAWIFQAGKFALANSEIIETRAKRKRLMTSALIFLAISWPGTLLFFSLFADPDSGTVTGTPAIVVMPFIFLLLAALFTLIFQAAKALCQAESQDTGERIFVTCLLLLYLIIGAPFLFRRLERLRPAADLRRSALVIGQ